MNIKDYYLDIDLIHSLDKEKSDRIYDLYNALVSYLREKELDIAQTYFNTLNKSGYLKNKIEVERSEKIDLING
jgi:hypothetical protein